MKLCAVSTTVVCALFATSAHPEGRAMTVADLQQICTGSEAESKAACRFYILGVTQGLNAGMNIADGKIHGGRPCVPEDLSGDALEFMVKTAIGQDLMFYPADRELDASGFVAGAIVHTFPCEKSK
jgi:hypothetical protein